MKLGWADFKYISTHPVISRRARDRGKRVNSMDALWYKLGYEVYQNSRVDPLDTDYDPNHPTDDSDAPLITPETALEHKLDYDVYRNEVAKTATHRHSAHTIYRYSAKVRVILGHGSRNPHSEAQNESNVCGFLFTTRHKMLSVEGHIRVSRSQVSIKILSCPKITRTLALYH